MNTNTLSGTRQPRLTPAGRQPAANHPADHAVVLGAGIGGLAAARVLADHYAHVTVIERDALPATAAVRRGVPQGSHMHGLVAPGVLPYSQLKLRWGCASLTRKSVAS